MPALGIRRPEHLQQLLQLGIPRLARHQLYRPARSRRCASCTSPCSDERAAEIAQLQPCSAASLGARAENRSSKLPRSAGRLVDVQLPHSDHAFTATSQVLPAAGVCDRQLDLRRSSRRATGSKPPCSGTVGVSDSNLRSPFACKFHLRAAGGARILAARSSRTCARSNASGCSPSADRTAPPGRCATARTRPARACRSEPGSAHSAGSSSASTPAGRRTSTRDQEDDRRPGRSRAWRTSARVQHQVALTVPTALPASTTAESTRTP